MHTSLLPSGPIFVKEITEGRRRRRKSWTEKNIMLIMWVCDCNEKGKFEEPRLIRTTNLQLTIRQEEYLSSFPQLLNNLIGMKNCVSFWIKELITRELFYSFKSSRILNRNNKRQSPEIEMHITSCENIHHHEIVIILFTFIPKLQRIHFKKNNSKFHSFA